MHSQGRSHVRRADSWSLGVLSKVDDQVRVTRSDGYGEAGTFWIRQSIKSGTIPTWVRSSTRQKSRLLHEHVEGQSSMLTLIIAEEWHADET